MDIKIGEKIRELRKSKNISQETLAQYFGVTFQAVSKWELGVAVPDTMLIPSIAAFFGVSIDDLFSYNRLKTDHQIEQICENAYSLREKYPEKAEALLREGLKQFPGNEILLNNLLYTMRSPERNKEVINICIALVEGSKKDDVRFDALRILAETYHDIGQQALVQPTLEKIPEIYFTKLELSAKLLDGTEALNAAESQIVVSLNHLIEMLLVAEKQTKKDNEISGCYHEMALKVLLVFYKNKPEIFEADFFGNEVKALLGEIR